jgi:hypothetical protein
MMADKLRYSSHDDRVKYILKQPANKGPNRKLDTNRIIYFNIRQSGWLLIKPPLLHRPQPLVALSTPFIKALNQCSGLGA